MNPTIPTELFLALVDASWRAGWLVLALLVARRFLRGRVPAQVWVIGWVVVATRLLLPVSFPISWSPYAWAVPNVETSSVVPPSAPSLAPLASEPQAVAEPRATAAIPVTPAPLSDRWSWPVWAALAWVAGGAGLFLARAAGARRFQRRLRAQSPPADLRLRGMVARECELLGGRDGSVAVCETSQVDTPALCGIFRPCLLFPIGLAARLTDAELRFVVRHELGHWRRGDLLVQGLLQFAVAVHWFNPLAWIMARVAREDCEIACDEFVLGRGQTDAADYGATLLKMLGMVRPGRRPATGIAILENRRQLAERVRRIARFRPGGRGRVLAATCTIALLTALTLTRPVQAGGKPIGGEKRDGSNVLTPAVAPEPAPQSVATPSPAPTAATSALAPTEPAPDASPQLRDAAAALRAAEIRMNQIRELRAKGGDLAALSFIANQPVVAELSKTLANQRIDLAKLHERYRERHPTLMAAQRTHEATKRELERAVVLATEQASSEYAAAAENYLTRKRELEKSGGKADELARVVDDYRTLERDYAAQKALLEQLVARERAAAASPPASDITVSVIGAVNAQGSVGFTAADKPIALNAIAASGGFAPNADRTAVKLLRAQPDGTRKTLALTEQMLMSGGSGDLALQRGDVIVVPEARAPERKFVTVLGAVKEPGRFPLPGEGRLTLIEALGEAGGHLRLADLKKVQVTRVHPVTRATEVAVVNIDALLRGTGGADAFFVQAGDVIVVPERIL